MDEGGKVGGAFFPADEEAAGAMKPAVGAFDDPAAGAPAWSGFWAVFTAAAKMQFVAKAVRLLPRSGVVVTFIQTQSGLGCRRTQQSEGAQGRFEQLVIVTIRSVHDHG